MSFAERVIAFNRSLRPPDIALPAGFEWLFPRWIMQYRRKQVREYVERYRKLLCSEE